ncbi:MAG: AAA family ATPase, partial [Prochloraceae cyanobacterium]
MSEKINRNSLLIQGLQRIIEVGLELPLVPLNGNKQPLGEEWQKRPYSASQLIQAIKNGGVEVPIKGKKRKLPIQGFGILTGRPINVNGVKYYLLALDQDGASAAKLIEKLSGGVGLPKTVTFSSGRPGRCQYLLLVKEQFAPLLHAKKLRTGVKGDDNKDEALEFRWSNQQSVLPPSVHPITGNYFYVDDCALGETEIAIAPNWVMNQMLADPDSIRSQLIKLALQQDIEVKLDGKGLHSETLEQINEKVDLVEVIQQKVALRKAGKNLIGQCPFHDDKTETLNVEPSKNLYHCYDCGNHGSVVKFVEQFSETIKQRNHKKSPQFSRSSVTQKKWTEEDYVRSYLESLSPSRADDYHDWISVGMALHSLGEHMLPVWVQWSQQSSKYKSSECEKKWRSFSPRKGVGLGTLAHMAKQDGWESPFKKQTEPNYSHQSHSKSPKMPIAEAVEIARQVLTSNRSKVEKNTLLEELRAQVGLSSREWFNSFIKPLKSEFSTQRLKLEVAAYVNEADPFEQIKKKGEICSNYRINSFDLKFLANKLEQEEETPKKIVWSFDDFLSQETNALKWIIPGVLPVGEMILLTALSKVGKTLLATDVMYGVLSGTKVLDSQVGVKGKVLLITSDESESSTKRRLRQRGFDLLPERNCLRIMTHLDILNLNTLEEQLEEFRPQLVVIDSLTSITDDVGVNEKDSEFARYVYRLKNLIGRYGAASILIHHENKDKEAKGINKVSGSARIPAAVWGIW